MYTSVKIFGVVWFQFNFLHYSLVLNYFLNLCYGILFPGFNLGFIDIAIVATITSFPHFQQILLT